MREETSPDVELRVTLLGTGGPNLSVDRAGAAVLAQAGTEKLLIDAGRGVTQRLYECGVPLNDITKVFFTHLHSDHIEGLPQLWITPWFLLGRTAPMEFSGPEGTQNMLAGMRQFLGHDVKHRIADDAPISGLDVSVQEFVAEGVVYKSDNLSVTAVPVDHKDGNPAFGFVITTKSRKVVISGDCTLSEDLIRVGQYADVVIHNVFSPSQGLISRDAHVRDVTKKLTSPEECSEVFQRTNTKLGIYTHIIKVDSSLDDIVARTRSAGFLGPLVLGEDRMVVVVDQHPHVIPSHAQMTIKTLSGRHQLPADSK